MLPSRPISPEAVRPPRSLWMSTPIRIALAVVLAVAAVLLALWFIPRDTPPIGQGSPSPTATSEKPSPSLEPSLTPEPTSTALPTPTVEPTPVSPPIWTGLDWSDPVTPSFTVHLVDLVPWGDGYVAVGQVPGPGWASLTSPDGLNWTIRERDFPGSPQLVSFGDELFAFVALAGVNPPGPGIVGAPPFSGIWHSTDGMAWASVDSSSWSELWLGMSMYGYPAGWNPAQHDPTIGLADVVAGSNGFVAIGNAFGPEAMAPMILHSADGVTWTATEVPSASDSALLNAVVVHGDRFVITGATGVWTDPATATAAAWYSDDGLTWHRATIEPDDVDLTDGAELGPLWAADDGLVACRGNREMAAGGWRYMDGWVSTDGTTWRHEPREGPHPACDWSASDGSRIVALGPRDHARPLPWPGVTVAYVSTDGVTWQPLELSSTLPDRLERVWVVPDGVLYAGVQSFWFGRAATE